MHNIFMKKHQKNPNRIYCKLRDFLEIRQLSAMHRLGLDLD